MQAANSAYSSIETIQVELSNGYVFAFFNRGPQQAHMLSLLTTAQSQGKKVSVHTFGQLQYYPIVCYTDYATPPYSDKCETFNHNVATLPTISAVALGRL
jgi:hypothetical protein